MAAEVRDRLPVVAVVGRPNVGKSSLVNRIVGSRKAIVEKTPGVTRDRRAYEAEWGGRRFEVIDTGGLEPGADGLDARVVEQAQLAMEAADVILLVVDGSVGPLEDDHLVAAQLRRAGRPVMVAANKVDDPRDEPAATAFYRLGLGEPIPLSALHGTGSGDLLDRVVEKLPAAGARASGAWASLALVGRPNVGKSSVLNGLLGEARALVDPAPGTTRDPVDAHLELAGGRRLRIVDTAGMRREVQIKDPIEYFSWLRSRQTLQRVDATVLIVDVHEGVTGHDQRIAEEIVSAGRACVVALNKWDLVVSDETDRARLEASIRQRLRFLHWATTVRTSAITGRGLAALRPAVERAVHRHRQRLGTSALNQIVRDAAERRPHPRAGGRPVRVLYAVQSGISPPRILLFSNRHLEPPYLRYLENAIRAAQPFEGTPIQLDVRLRSRSER